MTTWGSDGHILRAGEDLDVLSDYERRMGWDGMGRWGSVAQGGIVGFCAWCACIYGPLRVIRSSLFVICRVRRIVMTRVQVQLLRRRCAGQTRWTTAAHKKGAASPLSHFAVKKATWLSWPEALVSPTFAMGMTPLSLHCRAVPSAGPVTTRLRCLLSMDTVWGRRRRLDQAGLCVMEVRLGTWMPD